MYWSLTQLPELASASEQEKRRIVDELRWHDSLGTGFRIGLLMALSLGASYLTQGSYYYTVVNQSPLLKILVYALIVLAFLKFADLVYLNLLLRKRITKFIRD